MLRDRIMVALSSQAAAAFRVPVQQAELKPSTLSAAVTETRPLLRRRPVICTNLPPGR